MGSWPGGREATASLAHRGDKSEVTDVPRRANQFDFVLARVVRSLATSLRAKSNFSSRSNMFWMFKPSTQNNSVAEKQKSCFP
jgi:16S rRNA G527 N7-methylase RsmG